ncbi:hypothetical protein F8388_013037 [Cannabis sativa]|uniref:Uncharacterized protein n=1 Tax=Cannabis sativa TaxID=3483 RepID=A0A7J6ECX8_CANSA|nr:hypothetical protein F8388_013037 [Cannabis sativa]
MTHRELEKHIFSSISFKGLNLFDCLRGNLWDKVVPIKDQGLEQPSWRDVRAELGFVYENTHDGL